MVGAHEDRQDQDGGTRAWPWRPKQDQEYEFYYEEPQEAVGLAGRWWCAFLWDPLSMEGSAFRKDEPWGQRCAQGCRVHRQAQARVGGKQFGLEGRWERPAQTGTRLGRRWPGALASPVVCRHRFEDQER